jgi:hypothetical protein
MNRKKQAVEARCLIAATWRGGPPNDVEKHVGKNKLSVNWQEHCSQCIEAALDAMAEAHADHDEYTRKRARDRDTRRRVAKKLDRLRPGAEGAVTLAVNIDSVIAEARKKTDYVMIAGDEGIRVLSGHDPKYLAAELAYQLLRICGAPSKRKGTALSAALPATTANGPWCKLAAILYGKSDQNLFRAVHTVSNRIKRALAGHKIDTPRRQNSRIVGI